MRMKELLGKVDLVWLVLDALRYDVAQREMEAGRLPNLRRLLPGGWEKRQSPGTFTYAAHHAFFAGFLPTPEEPSADRTRLFAAKFAGSETVGPGTVVFEAANVPCGLAERGYHTLCIGGVGFFNKQSALSQVLPGFFAESHWSEAMGVTGADSTRDQFLLAARRLTELPTSQRVFLFINVSAIHQPNNLFLDPHRPDDSASHAAALRYVDAQLPILTQSVQQRGGGHMLIFSDHGTCYGEDGFWGHRVAHPCVLTVPYGETLLEGSLQA